MEKSSRQLGRWTTRKSGKRSVCALTASDALGGTVKFSGKFNTSSVLHIVVRTIHFHKMKIYERIQTKTSPMKCTLCQRLHLGRALCALVSLSTCPEPKSRAFFLGYREMLWPCCTLTGSSSLCSCRLSSRPLRFCIVSK